LNRARHRLCLSLLPLALCCAETPAAAEIGASVSVSSQARFRGYSLSSGRPVAALALSYDDAGGFYAGGSATAVATAHSGARFLGVQGNVGYARRLESGATLDVGVDRSEYSEYFSAGRNAGYTEVYVGLITPNVSSHIYYSPNYFGFGYSTFYGEIDGILRPSPNWRLNAHIGTIVRTDGERKPGYDWRLGISTQTGGVDWQLALSGGGPKPDFYNERRHSRTALSVGATYAF